MEGFLLKWTNYFSGWKERLFVLKGPLLYYYYAKNDKPRGKIHLGISTISAEDNSLCFQINTGSNILFIQAHSQDEREQWLTAIKISKLEGENQIKSKAKVNSLQLPNNTLDIIINNLSKETIQLSNLISQLNCPISEDFKELLSKYNKDIDTLKASIIKPNDEIDKVRENPFIIEIPKKKNHDNNKDEIYLKENEMFYRMEEDFSDEEDYDNYGSEINNISFIKKRDPFDMFDNPNNIFISQPYNQKTEIQGSKRELIEITDWGTDFNDPLYNYAKRTQLPVLKKDLHLNVWQFFKSAVGKDVNRFGVPVFFNEPISMLQKLCENFQYVYLLNKGAIEPNPYLRLAYCACFCISGFVMNTHRTTKFFNPLLFETYEYIDNEQNYRYFAEQVSHHPAISACFAEGRGWDFYTNNNAIINFLITGKIEIANIGRCYLTFKKFNENIVFTKPLAVVRNLIIGTIEVDIVGKFIVSNDKGDICEVDMLPSTSGIQGKVVGTCKDIYGHEQLKIEGNWLKSISIVHPKTKEERVIWNCIQSSGEDSYYYQPLTFDLNNLTEEMKNALPRTDSRFRPDQRLMEMQKIDEAGDEKHRLEEKQRAARKRFQKEGIIPKPMYFDETYDDITGELVYKYKGNYFKDRKNQNFEHFPDIF